MVLTDGNLLRGEPIEPPGFVPSREPSAYQPIHTFELPQGPDRHYSRQFADMYFLRLALLKNEVKQRGHEAWDTFKLKEERPKYVERVLDVRQGELCWVVGTVYLELKMKPNVLDDLTKEHWIAAPPDRETYASPAETDDMMLEDESGRLRIRGNNLNRQYVTGCIIAALGTEEADGTFRVVATQYADLPPQPQRWEAKDAELAESEEPKPKREKSGKLAIVSGLEMDGNGKNHLRLELLLEWLTGELCGGPDQINATNLTRLIVAGNSLAKASPIMSRDEFNIRKSQKRHFGQEIYSFNTNPAENFDSFLEEILPTLPITIIPGETDPASVAFPQQPIHPALMPKTRLFANPPAETNETLEGLDLVTNPWDADIEGWRVIGTAGQAVHDLSKYIKGAKARPIEVMEMMLRWRCIAPTAPDTLWCYPFQDDDPHIVKECPHIYFSGNMPGFATKVIEGPAKQRVRLIAVPKFRETGQVVVVDMETLEVELVKIEAGRPPVRA